MRGVIVRNSFSFYRMKADTMSASFFGMKVKCNKYNASGRCLRYDLMTLFSRLMYIENGILLSKVIHSEGRYI